MRRTPEPPGPMPWADLAALARMQGGHVALWQARAVGISAESLQHRVGSQGWERPHQSVVALPGVVPTERGDLWAALLAVADLSAPQRVPDGTRSIRLLARSGIEGVLTVAGWSAARQLGWTGPRPPELQLLAHVNIVVRRSGIRLIRSRRGIDGFWRWVDGLPVTRASRTLWDCAHLSKGTPGAVDRLGDLAVFFDRTRQLSIDQLIGVVDEPAMFGLPPLPPRQLVATAELLRPGFSHSETEAKARGVITEECQTVGLIAEPRPFCIRNERGVPLAEADVAIRSLLLDLEIDGPHHDAPSQKVVDRSRDGKVARIDWIVKRYPVREIERNWEAFRRRVRADLIRVQELRRREASAA